MASFATWNINSVRARGHLVLNWLERHPECDVLALQEIKSQNAQFPKEFEQAGFHVYVQGQKAYNGVALISRKPLGIRHQSLPGWEHDEARYLEAVLPATDAQPEIAVTSIYLPNGNSGGEAGFEKKLKFLDALHHRAKELKEARIPFVLMGDFNICPAQDDFAPGTLSADDALVRDEIRCAWHRLLWLGLTDGLRALHPKERLYTFWDYQNAAYQRNAGLRIDHFLLSPWLAERLEKIAIDREERAKDKPSDHAPVFAEFSL